MDSFVLNSDFVATYRGIKPDWGYKSGPNTIGEVTYYRTYSRLKKDGSNEDWCDTVARVVEGTFDKQREHCAVNGSDWSDSVAQASAQDMFDRIFNMKFLPPGRGLWMMGTEYVRERGGAPLNNCAFISTDELTVGSSYPFTFLMDMSMLGVGVGFDTDGAGAPVYSVNSDVVTFTVPDSREGWVESVGTLIDSYLSEGNPGVAFDYSLVRPAGALIKGFGGTASGPAPLIELHERIKNVLEAAAEVGSLSSKDIVDIQNMIGACVVAGNVRRSAELALGSVDDDEFLDLKNYEVYPERTPWSWASNNTIKVLDSDKPDYEKIAKRISNNGEPGLYYLDVARRYGRLGHDPDFKDALAKGTNPCAEQILESGELCTLVEVFPSRCTDIVDFLKTIKMAYLYAKTVTLFETHDERTNSIMQRNRRIGTSASGIVQFVHKQGRDVLEQWLEAGYGYIENLDRKYSGWLNVEESIRRTTVKPSGTVSLLAGVTPGVHYPIADTYIRRIRVAAENPIVELMRNAGYGVEPAIVNYNSDGSPIYSHDTAVISMPVKGEGIPTEKEVSIFDKAEIATFMAEKWSDNAVSCTITFLPDEASYIETVLRENEGKWKTVSFLKIEGGIYPQMPYEEISDEQYLELTKDLTEIDWSGWHGDGSMEKFCTTEFCELQIETDDAKQSQLAAI